MSARLLSRGESKVKFMSELENEFIQDDATDSNQFEEVETSELAPDSEPEHEEKPEESQANDSERVQEVINKKHRQMREAQEENERLRQQLQSVQSQPMFNQAPTVPELPDPFDVDEQEYQNAIKQRDEAIQARSRWDAQQQQQNLIEQQRQLAAQQQQQQEIAKKAESYQKRAKDYGIKPEALQQSAQVLVNYGLNDAIAQEILTDEKGPLITQHLAGNPLELNEVVSLPPIQAALYIERNIKPKLANVSPKKTNATRPKSRVNSTGHRESSGSFVNGSFE